MFVADNGDVLRAVFRLLAGLTAVLIVAACSASGHSSTPAPLHLTAANIATALLGPDDVPGGFLQTTYAEPHDAGPCDPPGTKPVEDRVPSLARAGRAFQNTSTEAILVERIAVYTNATAAESAFRLTSDGMGCSRATLGGSAINIDAPKNLTKGIGNLGTSGHSTGWIISNASLKGAIVATLAGNVLEVCLFEAPASTDLSTQPSVADIARAAYAKAVSA